MTSDVLVAVVGAGALVLGGIITFLGTRGKTRADAKAALDARIDARVAGELERVYKTIDEVRESSTRKMSAVARILRSIASQWPHSHGPDLDPRDLAEVEEAIPPGWFRRHPKEDV